MNKEDLTQIFRSSHSERMYVKYGMACALY